MFDSTVRIIKQINPDLLKNVFVVNSTIDNAKSLMESMQLKGKTFSSSHAETEHDLLRYFYSDLEFVRRAENNVNKEILHSIYGTVNINEFYVARTIRLSMLSPEIIHRAIRGTLPPDISLAKLYKLSSRWDEQLMQLGIAVE